MARLSDWMGGRGRIGGMAGLAPLGSATERQIDKRQATVNEQLEGIVSRKITQSFGLSWENAHAGDKWKVGTNVTNG